MRRVFHLVAVGLAIALVVGTAEAQTQPAPGPTRPPPVRSGLEQPGTPVAAGPTVEECRAGWNPSLEQTKQEFEDRCAKLKEAK
jgi:hypothetical protein